MRAVKLRLRRVVRRWKVKSLRTPDGRARRVEKTYTQALLTVPREVDVSDLVGRAFRCRREGRRLVFEALGGL